MKKSEMFKIAQTAVVDSHKIGVEDKLEIIKELMSSELTAKSLENYQAKEAEAKEAEAKENEGA